MRSAFETNYAQDLRNAYVRGCLLRVSLSIQPYDYNRHISHSIDVSVGSGAGPHQHYMNMSHVYGEPSIGPRTLPTVYFATSQTNVVPASDCWGFDDATFRLQPLIMPQRINNRTPLSWPRRNFTPRQRVYEAKKQVQKKKVNVHFLRLDTNSSS